MTERRRIDWRTAMAGLTGALAGIVLAEVVYRSWLRSAPSLIQYVVVIACVVAVYFVGRASFPLLKRWLFTKEGEA